MKRTWIIILKEGSSFPYYKTVRRHKEEGIRKQKNIRKAQKIFMIFAFISHFHIPLS